MAQIVVGVIVFCGTFATVVTLFLAPVVYAVIGRNTRSMSDLSRRLESEL